MNRRVHLYDAFSGISSAEKSALIKFLHKNSEEKDINTIVDAIDYALKVKPSFGGFIFTCWEAKRLIAVVLVNKTGMNGFNAGNVLTYACTDKNAPDAFSTLQNLIRQAIKHSRGEIALHLKPDSPIMPIFRSLGFEEQYVELRFDKKAMAVSAS